MIFYLFNSLMIGILFVDLLERRFPDYFKDFLLNASYNCIYFYSKLQIRFNQVKNKINLFIDKTPSLLRIKNDINKLNYYFHDKEFEGNNIDYCNGFNFYIYNYVEDNLVNKAIYYDSTPNMSLNDLSNIKFMLVEFNVDEKIYKVDFKTDEYNYYLVGNKFTLDFFIYYMNKYHNENINKSTCEKLFVKIIDHNVNSVEVIFTDKNESILLQKNEYIILSD